MELGMELLGRDAEVALGRRVVDEAEVGRGAGLLIVGEAGIGKTALLDAVLEDCRTRGLRVLLARAREIDRQLPFAPLVDVLGSAGDLLATGTTAVDHFRIVESICDAIERMTTSEPVALVIDDLHWADDMTLITVDRLLRRLSHMSLGVVCTTRPHPQRRHLASLIGNPSGHEIVHLEPLSEDDIDGMAQRILGARPGVTLADQLSGAAGNPLYVVELLAALRAEGAVRVVEDTAEVEWRELPRAFREMVDRELSVLGTTTKERLRMAAVLGSAFHVHDLAIACDRSLPDLVAELRPALSSRLLIADGERLRFRHELVRDALYGTIPEPERAALHAHVARSFREAGHALSQLAIHLLRGARTADAETLANLRDTAADLGGRAPETAVGLLEKALELTASDHLARQEVEVDLAEALAWAGRPEDAAGLARRVLAAGASPPVEHRAVLALTHALTHLAATDRSTAETLEELATRPGTGGGERARLLAEAAWALATCAEGERVVDIAEQAAELAAREGEPVAEMLALAALLGADKAAGVLVARDERLARLAALAQDPAVADSPQVLELRMWEAVELAKLPSRRHEALAMLRAGLEAAEERGAIWLVPPYHHMLGHVAFVTGEWDEAESQLELATELAARIGTRWFLWEGFADLAALALQREGPSASERWVERAEECRPRSWVEEVTIRGARAELLEDRGELAAALRAWEHAASLGGRSVVFAGPGLVRTAHSPGSSARAAGTAERIRQVAGSDVDRLAALRCEAWERSDPDAMLEVVAGYQANLWPPDAARAGEETATLLLERDRRDEAVAVLERAAEVWERCGAQRALRRVDARLREMGLRPVRRRAPVATGWGSLTEAELRVSELVAEGLVYREIGERLFISRRTVESHVASAFAKLGISSRIELAERYRRRSPDP